MLIVEFFFVCVCFRAQFHNLSNDRKNNLEIVHHMAMIKNQVGISLTLFFSWTLFSFSVALVHCILLFIVVLCKYIILLIKDVVEIIFKVFIQVLNLSCFLILENNRSIVESPRVFKKSLLVSLVYKNIQL